MRSDGLNPVDQLLSWLPRLSFRNVAWIAPGSPRSGSRMKWIQLEPCARHVEEMVSDARSKAQMSARGRFMVVLLRRVEANLARSPEKGVLGSRVLENSVVQEAA